MVMYLCVRSIDFASSVSLIFSIYLYPTDNAYKHCVALVFRLIMPRFLLFLGVHKNEPHTINIWVKYITSVFVILA